jgi:hypothetical protein
LAVNTPIEWIDSEIVRGKRETIEITLRFPQEQIVVQLVLAAELRAIDCVKRVEIFLWMPAARLEGGG